MTIESWRDELAHGLSDPEKHLMTSIQHIGANILSMLRNGKTVIFYSHIIARQSVHECRQGLKLLEAIVMLARKNGIHLPRYKIMVREQMIHHVDTGDCYSDCLTPVLGGVAGVTAALTFKQQNPDGIHHIFLRQQQVVSSNTLPMVCLKPMMGNECCGYHAKNPQIQGRYGLDDPCVDVKHLTRGGVDVTIRQFSTFPDPEKFVVIATLTTDDMSAIQFAPGGYEYNAAKAHFVETQK